MDYHRENLKERIKQLTGGAGADVTLDPVGGEHSEAAYRAMAWRGRFVVVGFATGEIPRIPLNLVLLKGADIRGFDFRPYSERAPEELARRRAELTDLLARGIIRPHISARFPLEHALRRARAGRQSPGHGQGAHRCELQRGTEGVDAGVFRASLSRHSLLSRVEA